MFIGSATIELEITDGQTLKDKRQVVRSVLDRLRSRFNVSAAEVGQLDSRQYATIAIVTVANDQAFVHEVLSKANNLVESEPRALVVNCEVEIL